MKKSLFIFGLFLVISITLNAQEEEAPPKDRPVRAPFASTVLIDNQTTVISPVRTMEYFIQHKFGTINNGISDVFGIYAPGANIRMALTYVPIKNMQLGYGLSRVRMYNDFSLKYTILEQTRRNTIPVAVAFYGNVAIDGSNEEAFGMNYAFTNRLSYFSQLIVGRRFNDWVSVQANASFTHYNKTEDLIDHDKIAVGVNGRVNITPRSSLVFQYDHPLKVKQITEYREFTNPSMPNIGLGWEIRTTTHAFHIYASSTDGLIPQHNAMFNRNDFRKGDIMFGFTITRLWSI
jgi:hypothetical protein